MSEWKPIETAPKDGTKIFAFTPDGLDGPDYAVVKWHEVVSYRYEESGDLYKRVLDNYAFWTGAEYTPFHATHWMPLPNPPKDS